MGYNDDYADELFKYDARLRAMFKDDELIPMPARKSLDVGINMIKNAKQNTLTKIEKEYVHPDLQDGSLVDGVVTLQKASKLVVDEKVREVVPLKTEKSKRSESKDDSSVDGEVLVQEASKLVVDEKVVILPKKKKSKQSRIVKILSNLLFYLCVVIALLSLFIYSDNSSTDKEILGYHFYNVLTTSMHSVIPQGSFVFVESVDANTIEIGDDITFYKDESTNVTHRVIKITENYNGSGARGFTTKGVDNPSADADIVYADNVVGVVRMHIPYMGLALKFVSNNLLFIVGMFGLVILLSVLLKTFFTVEEKKPIATKTVEQPIEVTYSK